jgi:hypothetical protein
LLEFDVFGKAMGVRRTLSKEWHLYKTTELGVRRRVYEINSPADFNEDQILHLLDITYSQFATRQQPKVKRVD